jgi:hypothetical protein
MDNASVYKKVGQQRPSVYRGVAGNQYENTINADEEGETANFGAMMDFHHSPQQDFYKRN